MGSYGAYKQDAVKVVESLKAAGMLDEVMNNPRKYTLKSDEATPSPRSPEAKAWDHAVRLKEKNEHLTAQLKEVVRLVKGCAYGEDKLTMQLLRELLHLA